MAGLVKITSTIWMLRLTVVNAYLVQVDSALALIDTGPRGSDDAVMAAIDEIGHAPEDLRHIVLTHSHKDHAGSAAALVSRTGAMVVAGAGDAPVIAGAMAEPPAAITEEERPFYEKVASTIPPAPHVQVDLFAREGDQLPWNAPRAVVLDAPGHTAGSIAIHLPAERVLFAGDNIASIGRRPILGPFNVSRRDAIASFHKLAKLDVEIACFGHGDPIATDAGSTLRQSATQL